jgi:hypothetical protein
MMGFGGHHVRTRLNPDTDFRPHLGRFGGQDGYRQGG